MKLFLTNSTKKRLIRELRSILYEHPKYRDDSNNVQNKFAFKDRPQRGIIVNNTSGDRVRLSADNYIGRISSFVMQAPVENYPGTSVEWVTENKSLLEEYSPRRDIFPTPPGVYILEITEIPNEARSVPGKYFIDPILSVPNELLIIFGQEAQLSHEGIYSGSVRLWLNGNRSLLNNIDYSVDYSIGLITFLKPIPIDSLIYADYRYLVAKQGPIYFNYDAADYTAIPGSIIAFGNRAQQYDKLAIVVGETRSEVADVYGGKFEINFDLVVFSKDPEDREQLVDYVVVKILEHQNTLGFDGLELLDISPGGESEEIYVSDVDDYWYDGAVAVSFRVDWEIYVPLPVEIFRSEITSSTEEQKEGFLTGQYTADLLRIKANAGELAGVASIKGKNLSYERIR